MSNDHDQNLLKRVSLFSEKWFNQVAEPIKFDSKSVDRDSKREDFHASKLQLFRKLLAEQIVEDVTEAFGLERCAILTPVKHKPGLFQLEHATGFPRQFRKDRKTYREGLGLTGKALEGQKVVTDDLLSDKRLSRLHGTQWVEEDGSIDENAEKRAFAGLPLWTQIADLHRRTFGALVAIRKQTAFSEYEQSVLSIVAEMISHAFSTLEAYSNRLKTDLRFVEFNRMWNLNISLEDKLQWTLGYLQQVLPFKRMLLTLINESRTYIEGRAVLGFRPGLASDTKRKLFTTAPDDPSSEDILAKFVREHQCSPRIVPFKDPHIHAITALRHQVENDLLLLPLVDGSNGYQGIILAEIPKIMTSASGPRLSAGELERFSLLATQIADNISKNRQKGTTELDLVDKLSKLFIENPAHDNLDSCCLRLICESLQIDSAALLTIDKRANSFRCETTWNFDPSPFMKRHVGFGAPNRITLAERAILSGKPCRGRWQEAFPEDSNSGKEDTALERWQDEAPCVAVPIGLQTPFFGALVVAIKPSQNPDHVVRCITAVSGLLSQCLLTKNLTAQLLELRRNADAQHSFAYRISDLGSVKVASGSVELKLRTGSAAKTLTEIVRAQKSEFESAIQDVGEALNANLVELFVPDLPVKLDANGQISDADRDVKFHLILSHFQGTETNLADERSVTKSTLEGLTAIVLQTLTQQTSPDVTEDEYWSKRTREFKQGQPHAWLGTPMVATIDGAKYCCGILSACRARNSVFDSLTFGEDEIDLAKSFAYRLAALFCQLHEVRTFRERIQSFLQNFDHDLPNLADHLDNLTQCLAHTPEQDCGPLRKRLTDTTGALKACMTSLLAAFLDPDEIFQKKYAVDLDRVQSRLAELIGLCSIGSGIQFDFVNGIDHSTTCLSDEEGSLLYVLYILVNNSFRSCVQRNSSGDVPPDGFRVEVRFEQDPQDVLLNRVRVLVRDNGGGFAADFGDPNVIREGVSKWKGKKGLGVGRAIVAKLLKRMGASQLSSKSRTDQMGADVEFFLSCRKREES